MTDIKTDHIKTRYFRGWMESGKMGFNWLSHWMDEAMTAEDSHNKLVIFELPEGYDLSRIEQFIQDDLK